MQNLPPWIKTIATPIPTQSAKEPEKPEPEEAPVEPDSPIIQKPLKIDEKSSFQFIIKKKSPLSKSLERDMENFKPQMKRGKGLKTNQSQVKNDGKSKKKNKSLPINDTPEILTKDFIENLRGKNLSKNENCLILIEEIQNQLKLKYKHLSFSIEVDNYFSIVYSQYLQSLEDTDSKSRKAQIALTQALKNLENIINQIKNFLDNTLTTQSPNLEQTLQNYKIEKLTENLEKLLEIEKRIEKFLLLVSSSSRLEVNPSPCSEEILEILKKARSQKYEKFRSDIREFYNSMRGNFSLQGLPD